MVTRRTRALSAFSWGYWGWGSNTKDFVKAADAVERRRGFEPPLFVDIRLSRKVRAVGFQDSAFAQVVGKGRYIWMPSMGNASIKDPDANEPEIADPSKAVELLEIIEGAGEKGRRVIFFCSCELPGDCHRAIVGDLLLEAALAARTNLTIQEWPGGEPVSIDIATTSDALKKLQGPAMTLPLPGRTDRTAMHGLPWYSLVTARTKDDQVRFLSGPAVPSTSGWALPVVWMFADREPAPAHLRVYGERMRLTELFGVRSTDSVKAWPRSIKSSRPR